MKKLTVALLATMVLFTSCSKPATQPLVSAATEPSTVATELATEATSEPLTEAVTEAPTEAETEPATEPAPLSFLEEHGLGVKMELGIEYPCFTKAGTTDEEVENIAKVTSYEVIESDETHPGKDGYVWRVLQLETTISPEVSSTVQANFQFKLADTVSGEVYLDDTVYEDVNGEKVPLELMFSQEDVVNNDGSVTRVSYCALQTRPEFKSISIYYINNTLNLEQGNISDTWVDERTPYFIMV